MRTCIQVLKISVVASVPFAVSVCLWWGAAAAWGLAGGLSVAMISVLSIGLLGHVLSATQAPRMRAVTLTTALWMVKLPIFALLIAWASRQGPVTVQGFVLGLALVYCVLFFWIAVTTRHKG